MKVTIYHNPRCSKSRQTLALLRARGVEPEIVEYLSNPPSAAEIERLLGLLRMEPRELLRSAEAAYHEAGLDDESLDRAVLIRAMADHPILIERPIVVSGTKAALGRPPERILEIF